MGKPKASLEEFLAQEDQRHKSRELESLKGEVAILRQRNTSLEKEADAEAKIIKFVKLAVDALPVGKSYSPPAPLKLVRGKTPPMTQESMVLACACWHIGETIDETQMLGLNKYDFEIFRARLQHLVDTTIGWADHLRHEFTDLWFWHLGDFVSGIIHEELEETNCLDIVEQSLLGAHVTALALRELAARFRWLHFVGLPGNHGRTKPKKQWKRRGKINWDYVAYNTVATLLRDLPNATFHLSPAPAAIVDVQGHKFHLAHGDTIKSHAGIPFYGIARERARYTEIEASRGNFFEHMVRSHFHTKGELQTATGSDIMVGSLKGGCEYALGLPAFNYPRQTLFGVHKKYGKTWDLPIDARWAGETSRYLVDRTKAPALQPESPGLRLAS